VVRQLSLRGGGSAGSSALGDVFFGWQPRGLAASKTHCAVRDVLIDDNVRISGRITMTASSVREGGQSFIDGPFS